MSSWLLDCRLSRRVGWSALADSSRMIEPPGQDYGRPRQYFDQAVICSLVARVPIRWQRNWGINHTTLSRWQREAHATPPGTNGFQAAEELKQLRREVERLRMERDILNKAAAFFAKESA